MSDGLESAPSGLRRRSLLIAAGVFTSGAVLLGVEIAASRVLAPFFGTSLFVWGALIGVVLTGLMIGYWLGGMLADRAPAPALLVSSMGLGALLVLLIPLVDGPVLEWVVGWDPGPRLNPLVAAVLLFGPASVVLAATTPIAVRLSAHSLAHLGRTSGRLFSISTAGSIAGTFLTAFFLIPELGTNQLLALAATTLAVVALAIAAVERVWPATGAVAALVVAGVVATVVLAPSGGGALSAVEAADWSPVSRSRDELRRVPTEAADLTDVIYSRDTQYHRLSVTESNGIRYLRFDNSWQSAMRMADPQEAIFAYTDDLNLGLAYAPMARTALFVGLGGGTAPRRMLADFPQLKATAVELDPEVIRVAKRYFALPDDPRLTLTAEDGRRFLTRVDEKWDLIVIDAFFADAIPFHLTTSEFMDVVRDRLAPGGVVVTNIIGSVSGERSKLFRSMYRTYRSAFASVAVHPVGNLPGTGDDEASRNIILIAGDAAVPARAVLEARWRSLNRSRPDPVDLTDAIRGRYERTIPLDVPTLTDDFAPTDHLLPLE